MNIYSFKERGARYALLMLNEEQKELGVISASLGNHAQVRIYYLNLKNYPIYNNIVISGSQLPRTTIGNQMYGSHAKGCTNHENSKVSKLRRHSHNFR